MGRSRWQLAVILAVVVGSLSILGAELAGRAMVVGRLSLLAEQAERSMRRYESSDVPVAALPPVRDGELIGFPLVLSGWTPVESGSPDTGRAKWNMVDRADGASSQEPGLFDIRIPFRGGMLYLRLSLSESFSDFHDSMRGLVVTYFAGIGVAAFAVGFLFFRSRFLRPIERLTDDAADRRTILNAAERLTTGPLEVRKLAEVVQSTSRDLDAKATELESALTGLKEAQDDLLRAETLSRLGQFSASIVHEIGNPLSVALGYCQKAVQAETAAGQVKDIQPKILEQLSRIRGIVEGLVAVQQNGVRRQDAVRVPDLVRSAARRLVDSGFVAARFLHISEGDAPMTVKCDPFLLEQVFWNAMKNAIEAIPADREPRVEVRYFSEGSFCGVTIADNGTGFPGDSLAYVQPLISTKGADGMGMGLALSLRIVEIMGGNLQIQSGADGAELTIRLPRHTTAQIPS